VAPAPGYVVLSGGRMAAALLVGMALGLWLELYRGHLRAARPRRLGLLARDLLFWAGATLIAAFGLYFANWFDVRLYALCAMALGILLTSALAGPIVRPASGGLTRALNAFGRALFWPVRAVARAFGRPHGPGTQPPSGSAGAAAVVAGTAPPARQRWWSVRR
jgi:spore cortex biosynthesis protein YabQ